MTKGNPNWEQFEHDIQEILGLDATICSGNQWHDQGDAVDNTNPYDNSFRLLVDAKFTEHMSYSVMGSKMRRWCETGTEKGKRAILALRFWPRGQQSPDDFVMLSFDDFAELYERASRIITLDKEFCDALDRVEEEMDKLDKRILGTRTVDRTFLEREDWKWKR